MSPRTNFHSLCISLFIGLEFHPHLRQLIWRVTTHPPTLLPEHPHTYAETQATGWGRLSYLSLLFVGTLHSDAYIFPFLLCFSLLFFSQLFVRPPQTAILLLCISFSWTSQVCPIHPGTNEWQTDVSARVIKKNSPSSIWPAPSAFN